jgi:hypothetical protein
MEILDRHSDRNQQLSIVRRLQLPEADGHTGFSLRSHLRTCEASQRRKLRRLRMKTNGKDSFVTADYAPIEQLILNQLPNHACNPVKMTSRPERNRSLSS